MTKQQHIDKNLEQLFHFWLCKGTITGIFVFLLFALLDYISTPENFQLFLSYRLIVAVLLLMFYFLAKKTANARLHRIYAYTVIAIAAVAIELMILKFNGHESIYYVGIILMGLCVLGFIPAGFTFHSSTVLLIYLIYLCPIIILDNITNYNLFFTYNFFILSTLVTGLFLRHLHHKTLIDELELQYDLNRDRSKLNETIKNLTTEIKERKATVEALQRSEQKYRSLVESTEDSIYLVDRNYCYLFMNKKHLSRLGLSEDECIGQPYSKFHSDRESNWFNKAIDTIFETGKSVQHEHTSQRDGRHYLLTLSPVTDDDNKTIAVTIVSKNVSQLKLMEDELRALSLTDELTSLYNRRGFFTLADHELKMANRLNKKIYMLYADLDNLKKINDTFGHKEGDSALIETANIFRNNYRESDIIARIGGDEFVIIPVGTDQDTVEMISARLQNALDNFNEKSGRRYKLSISIGITEYDPARPCSINDLLTRADKLMYEHKRKHKA